MSNVLPPSGQFELNLTKLIQGEPVLPDAPCLFNYNWNFETNMGLAHLVNLCETPVNITLHPIGLSGILAFMSDIPPTRVIACGKEVVVYRVLLHLNPETGQKSCAIMFNQDGSTIEASEFWTLSGDQVDLS